MCFTVFAFLSSVRFKGVWGCFAVASVVVLGFRGCLGLLVRNVCHNSGIEFVFQCFVVFFGLVFRWF